MRRIEGQRHQGGARGHDGQAELFRDAITEGAGADLRNRKPAGSHDQRACTHPALRRADAKAGCGGLDGFDGARLPVRHPPCRTFLKQSCDDLLSRVVAEQLPLVLLMEGDAVLAQQRDEVLRTVSREG